MSDGTLENYRSLHGLPELAGVADLAGAGGPGLGVQECVDRLKCFHYALQRVWQVLLTRIACEPIYELKMGYSYHAYLAAEHITLLRDRVAELRHPPLGLDKVPDDNLEAFFDEIRNAPDRERLMEGLYRVALPALRESMEAYREQTNPLTDAPGLRILRVILPEVEDMISWGEKSCAALEAASSVQREDPLEWKEELRGWLAASGGLAGTGDRGDPPSQRYSAEEFHYDSTPKRDERFPDPYNMGVHAEEFLYDESFESRDKVFMMFYKRLREIDVPEMMASILYEMVTESGDEGEGKRPWGFYRDMTRQLWDEARHAMMGEVGFARSGIDWPSKVMINFTWSKGLNEQLTPRERHAVLWFIEQGLMSKTGKRYEWEVGADSGDDFAQLIQDFDWADEVLHARIGRDWYVKDFETVAEAAAYGSACWDKVVSDWEQWKADGLTEHHNWWPDLYREVCSYRGEEPDPRVLAFDRSYAETRADLQRISASG
ncbi:MAG: hypothetical protein CMN03_08600 [Roseibacillus sp.]|nr:hypothetical protein [Roseibacillus sp.]